MRPGRLSTCHAASCPCRFPGFCGLSPRLRSICSFLDRKFATGQQTPCTGPSRTAKFLNAIYIITCIRREQSHSDVSSKPRMHRTRPVPEDRAAHGGKPTISFGQSPTALGPRRLPPERRKRKRHLSIKGGPTLSCEPHYKGCLIATICRHGFILRLPARPPKPSLGADHSHARPEHSFSPCLRQLTRFALPGVQCNVSASVWNHHCGAQASRLAIA